MKYLFFIFLFLIPFTLAYSTGEKLNLSYSNITDADYPCEFRNGSVYLRGDINVGEQDCLITYYDSYTEEVVTTPSSSGGGSSGSKVICTPWKECVNNRTLRLCNIGKRNYNQTKSCISNETQKKIQHSFTYILKNQTTFNSIGELNKQEEQTVVEVQPITPTQVTQEVIPTTENKKGFSWVWIIVGVVLILVVVGFIFIWMEQNG
jgi:hypothetical protein